MKKLFKRDMVYPKPHMSKKTITMIMVIILTILTGGIALGVWKLVKHKKTELGSL